MNIVDAINSMGISRHINNNIYERKELWSNGRLKNHVFFLNFLLHGNYKKYNKDGDLIFHGFYVKGDLKEIYVDLVYKIHCP